VPSKILAQAGISLADVYDVQGSIAGVEKLLSEEVQVVHEMGGVLFSERLSGTMRRRTTGNLAQNVTFFSIIDDLPATPFRIQNFVVSADNAARFEHVAVSVRQGGGPREIPIFVWNATTGDLFRAYSSDGDGGVTTVHYFAPLQPANPFNPIMLLGQDAPQVVDEIALRVRTTGFGAGTAVATLTMYITFPQVGGISSYGLPIPSW